MKNSNNGAKAKDDKEISSLFQDDIWVRRFMQEIYDMFGVPASTSECLNQTDKILFVWGMMNLMSAMKKNSTWKDLKDVVDPKDAAYIFTEEYYNDTGKMLMSATDKSAMS